MSALPFTAILHFHGKSADSAPRVTQDALATRNSTLQRCLTLSCGCADIYSDYQRFSFNLFFLHFSVAQFHFLKKKKSNLLTASLPGRSYPDGCQDGHLVDPLDVSCT